MSEKLDPVLAHQIAAALQGLRYGSIELIVHDACVVQFERREKVRFGHVGESHRRPSRGDQL